jgi:hypothetical protein
VLESFKRNDPHQRPSLNGPIASGLVDNLSGKCTQERDQNKKAASATEEGTRVQSNEP